MGFNPGLIGSANALANLLLVTPNVNVGYQAQSQPITPGLPVPQFQAPSFLFNYEAENTVQLQSDITDHYLEDNTAIQSQISLKPELITVRGYIGELTSLINIQNTGIVGTLVSKLSVISPFLPGVTTTIQNGLNTAQATYTAGANLANSAVSAWNTLSGAGNDPVQTKQQIAFGQFYGFRQSRTLFTLQTPWCVFQNCAILTMTSNQDGESESVSDFEITFKVLRFATTSTIAAGSVQGRANAQQSVLINNGTSSPSPTSTVPTGAAGLGL
jgi:hypothetical protein